MSLIITTQGYDVCNEHLVGTLHKSGHYWNIRTVLCVFLWERVMFLLGRISGKYYFYVGEWRGSFIMGMLGMGCLLGTILVFLWEYGEKSEGGMIGMF